MFLSTFWLWSSQEGKLRLCGHKRTDPECWETKNKATEKKIVKAAEKKVTKAAEAKVIKTKEKQSSGKTATS